MKENDEISKVYEPHDVENKWIDLWLKNRVFSMDKPDASKPSYSVVIPPPNVTGSLHMGHALNSTIQDILVRYHRMKGFNALWVVGTDHAGIATQNVVERQLKEEGKSRFDLGREKFVERVWEWKKKSGGTIIGQLKRLGASCDYDNERFTMDDGLSGAVKKVFVDLYNEGLIYRGNRLINWCPRCQTSLSDLEVEHESKKTSLWHIRYPVDGGWWIVDGEEEKKDYVVVATTRPETLFGDVAIAVHSDDERYKASVGKKVKLPLTNRSIPVVADSFVDQAFGSGVVKITPAHDFNDFAVSERLGLTKINILDKTGKLNDNVPDDFKGMDRFKARDLAVAKLEEAGLIEKIEPYGNSVGHCYRCKTVVEPYLSDQWFVKTKPLADTAMKAVREGHTRFVPQHWEKTYFQWMENIQDWCVSRQIWWGHQIPAWYCMEEVDSGSSMVDSKSTIHHPPSTIHLCPPIVSETPPLACPKCGSTKLIQDPDVLDTWFSSGLWPFSTLGWPENTERLKTFYPTSSLVTAFDIIFFWVARMMMFGCHFMAKDGRPLKDAVPFKDVHIHALVRDPTGQKMSKSKGNVVDPLVLMEKYGTDAFRFTLAAFAAQGRDIKLDEARVEGYRNFCNKIWNASRFAMMNAEPFIKSVDDFKNITPKNRFNQWILFELNQTIDAVSKSIEGYEFNRGAHTVYNFFWQNFCSWYIELTKEIFRSGTDAEKIETARTTFYVLDTALRLMHPFMPFITEEIWQMLGDRKGASIAKSNYPVVANTENYKKAWQEVNALTLVATAIRNIRQETGVPLKEAVKISVIAPEAEKTILKEIEKMIGWLATVSQINFVDKELSEPAALAMAGNATIMIPLAGLIDIDKEKARQDKKMAKVDKDIAALNAQLGNENFAKNADAELLEEKQNLLKAVMAEKALIERAIGMLK
ncbi:valine--tRNA ligase [bacterium]|nr:valine--tRNA ligase [bacterium]